MNSTPGFHSDVALKLSSMIMKVYWGHIWKELDRNPELKSTVPAFLVNPTKLIYYVGRTHIGIEYEGPMVKEELDREPMFEVKVFDYRNVDNLLDEILGISYDDSTLKDIKHPLPQLSKDLYLPTNRAHDALQANRWNFVAQDMIMAFNFPGFRLEAEHSARIIDSYFYDADDKGLKVRHVKWLDLFPCEHRFDVDEDHDGLTVHSFPNPQKQAVVDAHVSLRGVPDFQIDKLRQLNRFVELLCSIDTSEPDITHFLAEPENQFIIKMAFLCNSIYPEKECDWAEPDKKPIKPDFFSEQPNGFANIMEFKLPTFGGTVTTGTKNRETFTAKINSYVSQTRVYEEYFEDPRNREHVKTAYGITVRYPRRYLIVGRRWMFSTEDWKKIQNDFRNLDIITYDDLVDGVRSQLYS